jgi:MoxR-like ATPase
MLRRYHLGFDAQDLDASALQPVITPADLPTCQAEIRAVTVEEGILRYITQIATATRRSPDLILGGSPRASINTLLAAKTYAALHGRPMSRPTMSRPCCCRSIATASSCARKRRSKGWTLIHFCDG